MDGGLYPPPGVPSGSTRNDSESMWIHMDSEQGVELTFTYALAYAVCMDPRGSHGFQVKLHRMLGLYSDNSELTFMCVD
jgi:hypothetical protein